MGYDIWWPVDLQILMDNIYLYIISSHIINTSIIKFSTLTLFLSNKKNKKTLALLFWNLAYAASEIRQVMKNVSGSGTVAKW